MLFCFRRPSSAVGRCALVANAYGLTLLTERFTLLLLLLGSCALLLAVLSSRARRREVNDPVALAGIFA